jgi:GNAT superfamily N-acetyltransferase
MVLPATATVPPPSAAVEIVDALADEQDFWDAERVQSAAFDGSEPSPGQHQRFENARADPARHLLLARVDGQPAGAGWATVREDGVLINGGAVDAHYRGRGIYRALVAARLQLAREHGVAGLGVQANPATSGPILAGLGFRTVGTWRFHLDSRL